MPSKYQGFTPTAVLAGFLAIVLSFATGLLFDLNRQQMMVVLIVWTAVLLIIAGWLRKKGGGV